MSTPKPDPAPFDGPPEGIGYPLDPPTSINDAGSGAAPSAAGVTPAYGSPETSPVRPDPQALHPTPLPRQGLSRAKIMAITPLLATIAFFVCGFAFRGWAWAWVFWLSVPIMGILTRDDDGDGSRR